VQFLGGSFSNPSFLFVRSEARWVGGLSSSYDGWFGSGCLE
jgi:hypothetical protein